MLKESNGLFQFFVEERFEPKNGDQVFFGVVQAHGYKTWAYFSQNQLNVLQSDFKTIEAETTLKDAFPVQRGFHYSKKKAQEKKHFFNLSFIYLGKPGKINDWDKKSISTKISLIKKNPFLNLIMDDKQEVFYGKKSHYDFKKAYVFRMPQFNCSFAQALAPMETFSQVVEFLVPIAQENQLKVIKKHIRQNWVTKKDPKTNFYYLSILQLINKTLGTDTLVKLLKQDKFKIIEDHFQDEGYAFLNESSFKKSIENLFVALKEVDSAWAEKVILKWNLHFNTDISTEFSNYMKTLKEHNIPVPYTRYNNLRYLGNLISKEYCKVKAINFELKNTQEIDLNPIEEFDLDGYTVKLPSDYKTLIQIGSALHNCAGNFEQIDYYQRTISLAFYKEGKVEFLASLEDGDLTQFKGWKNSSPPEELFNSLVTFLEEKKYIKKSKAKFSKCCVQRDARHDDE